MFIHLNSKPIPKEKKNILLLGSSGFIGTAVYNRLKPHFNVISAGRKNQECFVDLNIGLEEDVLLHEFTTLIHCAGVTDEEIEKNPEMAWKRTTHVLPNMLKCLQHHGLKQIIYISTAHVYGLLDRAINENSEVDPQKDYALIHYATEQIIKRTGLDVIILRPSTIYGISKYFNAFSRHNLIPYAFADMAIKKRKIVIKTTGEQLLNFVDIDQIAEHIYYFLEKGALSGHHCYNEAGLRHLSVLEYARIVQKSAGEPCDIIIGDSIVGGERFHYSSSLEPIAITTIDEDVKNTIELIRQGGTVNG